MIYRHPEQLEYEEIQKTLHNWTYSRKIDGSTVAQFIQVPSGSFALWLLIGHLLGIGRVR